MHVGGQTGPCPGHPDLRVTIFPARVQGEGAVLQMMEGLRALPRLGCDVVVLARGGGSAEDLAAFNDERLARAVADSPVPTISAVGHETDWTLVDFVADVRAATPSAAAEIVVGAKEEIVRGSIGSRSTRGTGSGASSARPRRISPASETTTFFASPAG
jgi:exodeoxyribonuclease VII large subunit